MTNRENFLRAYTFRRPERIPIIVAVNTGCWKYCEPTQLEHLMLSHPYLFPDFQKGLIDPKNLPLSPLTTAGVPFVDSWGCTWETTIDGIIGTVTKNPLDDWSKLDSFVPPDPQFKTHISDIDWNKVREDCRKTREQGRLIRASLWHGFFFMTLEYLRGFENLLFDMCDSDPRLDKLIAMVESFCAGLVSRTTDCGVEILEYPEDLGTQTSSLISPELFRKYVVPSYRRLMAPAKEAGALVHMHSDGYIMNIVDDILDCGVDIINPQDLVNGIDNIRDHLKGRVAIELDIDRQSVTRFGTPKDIDDHIRECVVKLGDPQGGLSLVYGIYPGIPIENIAAVMDALEKYSLFYSQKL
jgi:uroporphyrinogen decarboxylase